MLTPCLLPEHACSAAGKGARVAVQRAEDTLLRSVPGVSFLPTLGLEGGGFFSKCCGTKNYSSVLTRTSHMTV